VAPDALSPSSAPAPASPPPTSAAAPAPGAPPPGPAGAATPAKLFLVDGANLAYRSFFAFIQNPLTNTKGMNTSAPFGFTQTLLKLVQDERPDYIAVVWDPEGPTERHVKFAEYKATRQKMPDEMEESLPYIDRIVEGLGVAQVLVEGWEADDVIGTLAVQGADRGLDVYILSTDKDFLQLARPNLRVFNIRRGFADLEVLGPGETAEKWGVGPGGIRDVLALMGDASDNVPGVPGVGEKTAVELVKEFGSVEGVLANAEKVKRKNVREALLAGREQALLSLDLVTIRTSAPVSLDLERMRRRDPDPEALLPLFLELEFHQLVSRVARRRREQPVRYVTVDAPEALDALAATLAAAPEFAFDTETTGLDALTADLVGLSFSAAEGEAAYIPVMEPGEAGTLFAAPRTNEPWLRRVLATLRPILEDPARPKGGQNAKYDILVLGHYGIEVRGLAFDTMIASYLCDPSQRQHNIDVLSLRYLNEQKIPTEELIGKGKSQVTMAQVPVEKVSRYACEDADFALRLHRVLGPRIDALGMRRLHDEVEIPLVGVLARMERAGMKVDAPLLGALSKEYEGKLAALEKEIHVEAGEPFNVDSPKQLAAVLFEKLEVQKKLGVRVKRLKTGYSTDQSVLEQLTAHPVVAKVMEYRQLRKLKGTYLDALPALAGKDGLIHTSFQQAVAATGRLSSSDPNLQNIPIRTDEGRRIRAAFVARASDRVLLSADYSQIELRVLAHVAGDETLVEAFRRGEDVHRATAARVFRVEPAAVTSDLRAKAKVINFGIIYGMGAQRLARETGMAPSEAEDFIKRYFETFPGIKRYIDATVAFCEKNGYVQTLFGRRRLIPEISMPNPGMRSQARNMAVNTPIQGTAADLIKVAMVRIDAALRERGLGTLMVLQVHDELVFDAPASELEEVKALVRAGMEGAFSSCGEFRVPLRVDMGAGRTWLDAHG
jgi:DNA polymerase-1